MERITIVNKYFHPFFWFWSIIRPETVKQFTEIRVLTATCLDR